MTETIENTTGTALAQVAPGALARAKGSEPWTVADLAEILAAPAAELPEADPFPAPAKPVNFTTTLRSALRNLPKTFGLVSPAERRRLGTEELAQLTAEIITIDTVSTQLGTRKTAIQEIVRTHMDFVAEAEGVAGDRVADGVAKGHYLAAKPSEPFEIPVDGYADCWQQRFVKGKTSQDKTILDGLVEAGTISREEMLGFTREVRTLDDAKIAAFIRKNPARGLQILAAITTRSAPSASLYPPKK
jgi:hypothetical protein